MEKIIKAVNKTAKHIKKKKDQYEKSKNIKKQDRELVEILGADTPIEITISAKSIIKIGIIVLLVLAVGQLIIQLQNIIILTAISFFVALSLSPILDAIETKLRLPRPIAILLIYLFFFGALGLLFVKILPILSEQLSDMATDVRQYVRNTPETLSTLQPWLERLNITIEPKQIEALVTQNLSQIAKNLQSVTQSTVGVLTDIFQGLFNLIFALVLIFFILLERESIGQFLLSLFPKKDRNYLITKTNTIQIKMADWIKAQIILMVSVGAFMYVGAKIMEITLGMKYAATIGLLAGFMELFPYIGVWVTGIFMILIAINISWWAVFISLALITLVQFLEGNVLIPLIMEKVIGLSSVATILAIAIGGILGNMAGGVPLSILGMILAVPIAASISIFIDEYSNRQEAD